MSEHNESTFLANYTAPKIELANTTQFKSDKDNNLNNKIKARLGDLQREFNELEDLYNFNILIDEYEYNFIPVSGHIYFLYNHEGHKFLSLIEPDKFLLCKNSFVCKCRYNGLGFFEKEVA